MSRPWRIEYEGAIYHVLGRENERRDIFWGEGDQVLFLTVLEEITQHFKIEIFSYVLMSNHHLLSTRHANLSKAMQWLGVTYT